MVPDELHDFFVASAGVAGVLIDLLLVAISVHPEQIGTGGNAAVRFRPSAALSALLNALPVSLVVLIPDQRVGGGVIAFGVVGLVAVAALACRPGPADPRSQPDPGRPHDGAARRPGAWRFVGATMPGLLGALLALRRRRAHH